MSVGPARRRNWDNGLVLPPSKTYEALGGAAGCRAFAKAFYARVALDPVLRPFFPSTFTCAIEEFAAFLVQLFGGETEAMQRRWWVSLKESHSRFSLGAAEREAWLRAMSATLADESVVSDAGVRTELRAFFEHSSSYVVGEKNNTSPEGELGELWAEQVALDEAVALAQNPNAPPDRCIRLMESLPLQARFTKCPSVHASLLAIAAVSQSGELREFAMAQLRTQPALAREEFKHGRTLLTEACAKPDLAVVELLLELGAGTRDIAERALYSIGNECSKPGGGAVVRLLMDRTEAFINTAHGSKRCTALHMAARRGNTEVIAALLDAGADIESRDSQDQTPLRRAVNCGKVEAARLLLERGGNPDSLCRKGLTPRVAARTNALQQAFDVGIAR